MQRCPRPTSSDRGGTERKPKDMVFVKDPNYPLNNGEREFPLRVYKGWNLSIFKKSVVAQDTVTIRDRDHFIELFRKWTTKSPTPRHRSSALTNERDLGMDQDVLTKSQAVAHS